MNAHALGMPRVKLKATPGSSGSLNVTEKTLLLTPLFAVISWLAVQYRPAEEQNLARALWVEFRGRPKTASNPESCVARHFRDRRFCQ
jgi:hypothetical protein